MVEKIRFVSRNNSKLSEAKEILQNAGVDVLPLQIEIDELQTQDTEKLVKDKTLKAFLRVGRPLFVEHTGLYLERLGGLPGGLTQNFWDALEADKFSELFGEGDQTAAQAKTVVGFTDGRSFEYFNGKVSGRIANAPRGKRDFQWDCVFIPDGYTETFAELGPRKNEISMRRLALDAFSDFLKKRNK